MLLYAGLNPSPRLLGQGSIVVEKFSEILMDNVTSLTVAWNYLLIFQDNRVIVCGHAWNDEVKKLVVPDSNTIYSAIAGKEYVTILTNDHQIWQYQVYKSLWKKIDNFLPSNDEGMIEHVIKIDQNSCIVALTNLGRVFNIPNLVEIPIRVKFTDIACGFDHTIMLAENGDVYSMGMGTRGQLGHGDLEDSDDPRLIEALAGLEITQISAGAWHSAAITNDGDLYTWGWNTSGELGFVNEQNVFASPCIVDFKDANGGDIDVRITKVQCGNSFTICMSDNGTLWGAGSNKYGQLGQSRTDFPSLQIFTKLEINFKEKVIQDFYCKEWGSTIVV